MLQNCLYSIAIIFFTIAPIYSQSVRLVKDITPGSGSTFSSDFMPSEGDGIVLSFRDKVLFLVKEATNRHSLWSSNGEEDSTFIVHDIEFSGYFTNFVNDDPDYIYYFLYTSNAQHLYSLNKNTLDTARLYSHNSISNTLTYLNGTLYFSRNSGLWKFDLTTSAAELVYQFGFSTGLGEMCVFNGQLIIIGNGNNGTELFRSDGTTEGTESFYQLNSGTGLMASAYMTPVGDKLFFFYKAPGFSSTYYLYVTDGTAEGTVQLVSVDEPRLMNHYKHRSIIGWNGKLYFNANPDDGFPDSNELYVSDGTLEGTHIILFGDAYPRPEFFTAYKDELFFSGNVAFSGQQYQVHKSDGTESGTSVAINPLNLPGFGGMDFGGAFMVVHNDSLYFNGKRNLYGSELWISDGTAGNTRVIDIVPGSQSSEASQMTSTDKYLFMICKSPEFGKELYILDHETVSTADVKSENISISPNPFKDKINIQYDENMLRGDMEIEVFDIKGKLVHFSRFQNDQNIELSKLPAGSYLLIIRNQGQVISKKVIKQ